MANILIVITSILIGLILQKVRNFPVEAPKALNAYLIYVVLPAVSLLHISKLNLGLELLLPVSVGWIIFTITWILFGYLGKRFGWDKKQLDVSLFAVVFPIPGL